MPTLSTKNIDGSLRRMHKARKLAADNANNDNIWSKLASISKINEIRRISMSIFEQKPPARELDLQDLSEKDLASLKKSDPFLYYSIPGVRSASVALKDVDYSDVDALCQQGVSKGRSSSRVVRRSCVSFECHTSLVMEDMLLDGFSDDEFSSPLVDEMMT